MLHPEAQAHHAGWTLRFPRVRGHIGLVGRDRRLGAAAGVAIAALAAFLLSLVMPRGPLTTGQALVAIGVGLAVGIAAGYVLRSRWAMLLAPLAFAGVFELRWLGIDGPTVDGFPLDTSYGILAILLGRGFFGLVALLPMLLGVSVGAALARRATGTSALRSRLRGRVWLYSRRTVTALVGVGLVALVLLIARPASTPAINGPDGNPLPGSISELTTVKLGGGEQWLSIRGNSADNPVLLVLSGGPGQTSLAFTRVLWPELEQNFVVVNWDQRGNGKSMPALEPTSSYTLDGIVDDTIGLTNYLRNRFDEQKIYLVGQSWGSTLGVLAAQRRPDLYYAIVGGGQMVSQTETDRRIYRDLLAYSTRTRDAALADKLHGYGEPPYHNLFANLFAMGKYEDLTPDYTIREDYDRRGSESGIGFWGILGSEYNLVDKVNVLRGGFETFALLYPQLDDVDFRTDVRRLEVPTYMVLGNQELKARSDLAREWFTALQAPRKQMWTFDRAGHEAIFEAFGPFQARMVDTVLADTYPTHP